MFVRLCRTLQLDGGATEALKSFDELVHEHVFCHLAVTTELGCQGDMETSNGLQISSVIRTNNLITFR